MDTKDICKKCRASCCKLGGTDFTLSEKTIVLDAGYPNFFVKIDDNHYELDCVDGICPYLTKQNTCAIYEYRPLACKSFPVYVNVEDNKLSSRYKILPCPLSKFLSEDEIKEKQGQVDKIEDILKTTFSKSKLPKRDLNNIAKRFNKIQNGEIKI